jgi:transcriptional regulator with XRE-family HTH domain
MLKPSMRQTIAASRSDFGMSLQDLADRAGITKSHLWDLEQGRSSNPTVKTINALAEALGHTFAFLAQGAINDVLNDRK